MEDLCECKFGAIRSPAAVERELQEKMRAFPNQRNRTIGLRVFACKKPSARMQTKWHDLRDIYE